MGISRGSPFLDMGRRISLFLRSIFDQSSSRISLFRSPVFRAIAKMGKRCLLLPFEHRGRIFPISSSLKILVLPFPVGGFLMERTGLRVSQCHSFTQYSNTMLNEARYRMTVVLVRLVFFALGSDRRRSRYSATTGVVTSARRR